MLDLAHLAHKFYPKFFYRLELETDSLVTKQTKVNVIEQTTSALVSQIDTLETDLVVQKGLEKRKEIFSKIKNLDDDFE